MRKIGVDETLELRGENVRAIGGEVELEELDRGEAFALGIEAAEHRSQRAGANLMENPKRAERVWSRAVGRFQLQVGCSSGRKAVGS